LGSGPIISKVLQPSNTVTFASSGRLAVDSSVANPNPSSIGYTLGIRKGVDTGPEGPPFGPQGLGSLTTSEVGITGRQGHVSKYGSLAEGSSTSGAGLRETRQDPLSLSASMAEPSGLIPISVASLQDPLLPLHTTQTKFTMDLKEFTCRVEDHEHNVFDIDLKDPLAAKVSLSGEVDGLKPTAVSENPIEPRLFVVSRSAEAVEVLSTQDVSELERAVAICPDAIKTISGKYITYIHKLTDI
jgi:hypothetical protein